MISEIARYCSASVCGLDPNTEIREISTDTRTIRPGSLFVPLCGERFDGHDFIAQARAAGAAAVLSSRGGDQPGTLYVADTLRALQDIAAAYRLRFDLKVTAVTGSVGKTTTKEMIAAVLSETGPTLKTEGNLNNLIGLPLSVLRLERKHRAAVFEMGMNHFGEIAQMTRIAAPDVAVISNIGVAHIEFLGSREGIRKAKLEILEGLRPGGCAVLNGDEPLLWSLRDQLPCRAVWFGMNNPDCDVRAADIRSENNSTQFRLITPIGEFAAGLPAVGSHNVSNALSAAAVGLEYTQDGVRIAAGLARFQNAAMRQNILEANGVTLIDDCYNANPDSMAAALEVLRTRTSRGKRIAVLGDMRELGAFSAEAHTWLGEAAARSADHILLTGTEVEHTLRSALLHGKSPQEVRLFANCETLAEALLGLAEPGDVIVLKASRGMKLEQVRDLFLGERLK